MISVELFIQSPLPLCIIDSRNMAADSNRPFYSAECPTHSQPAELQ